MTAVLTTREGRGSLLRPSLPRLPPPAPRRCPPQLPRPGGSVRGDPAAPCIPERRDLAASGRQERRRPSSTGRVRRGPRAEGARSSPTGTGRTALQLRSSLSLLVPTQERKASSSSSGSSSSVDSFRSMDSIDLLACPSSSVHRSRHRGESRRLAVQRRSYLLTVSPG
jgi:hypothetical protein